MQVYHSNIVSMGVFSTSGVSTVTVYELQYAVDAALPSHSPLGLQDNLNALADAYHRVGLIINTKKNPVYTALNSTFSGLYLPLTIRVCLHSFSRCCLPNLRNNVKFRAVRGRSRSLTMFKFIELDRLDANRRL